ncbi:MAG: type II toxin-antitoxin system RelE/ParE family toxin [Candidatus Methylomirabilales bacterium]
MSYTVRLKPRAERELDRLPIGVARRVWEKLLALEREPRPRGAAKLEGIEGYRIRVGDYRIVYLVDDDARVVDVARIGHRREIYR